MAKKKFKDTVLGKLLISQVAPHIPVVGKLISSAFSPADAIQKIADSPDLTQSQKTALRQQILELERLEIERDIVAQQEVTKRWSSDNAASSLTKYVRPSLLIFLTITMTFFTIIDSVPKYEIHVAERWVSLWETLAMTVYGGYFLGKSVEKTFKK